MPDNSPTPADDTQSTPQSPAVSTATTTPAPPSPKRRDLPAWKVLLHNDDINDQLYVVETIHMLTRLPKLDAEIRMEEAHRRGVSLLMTTHKEKAELLQQQFASRNLTVTIEPVEG